MKIVLNLVCLIFGHPTTLDLKPRKERETIMNSFRRTVAGSPPDKAIRVDIQCLCGRTWKTLQPEWDA